MIAVEYVCVHADFFIAKERSVFPWRSGFCGVENRGKGHIRYFIHQK